LLQQLNVKFWLIISCFSYKSKLCICITFVLYIKNRKGLNIIRRKNIFSSNKSQPIRQTRYFLFNFSPPPIHTFLNMRIQGLICNFSAHTASKHENLYNLHNIITRVSCMLSRDKNFQVWMLYLKILVPTLHNYWGIMWGDTRMLKFQCCMSRENVKIACHLLRFFLFTL
jgi:hypothetical protein